MKCSKNPGSKQLKADRPLDFNTFYIENSGIENETRIKLTNIKGIKKENAEWSNKSLTYKPTNLSQSII